MVGITSSSDGTTVVTCQSLHLTSFAVLVNAAGGVSDVRSVIDNMLKEFLSTISHGYTIIIDKHCCLFRNGIYIPLTCVYKHEAFLYIHL